MVPFKHPELVFRHPDLADGRWDEFDLATQLGHVGSEISRALKSRDKHPQRAMNAVDRALELLFLTKRSLQRRGESAALGEICRDYEVVCDFFYGDNEYGSTPESILKYHDIMVFRGK